MPRGTTSSKHSVYCQHASGWSHMIAGMLTAKTGPHIGSYSSLYVPDPRGSHIPKD
jgi:hypothetical protein